MKLEELDYELPEELIAQTPLAKRDASRLLSLNRDSGAVAHRRFSELPSLMPPSLFVLNNTRVFPARLHATKETGGRVELLLLHPISGTHWAAIGRASKGLAPGTRLTIAEGFTAEVIEKGEHGELEVVLRAENGVDAAIERHGVVPLPPYIHRAPTQDDRDRYQTVFAKRTGAVAAPTAGLHFTPELLEAMREAGHRFAEVTLHVGPGTFRPIQAESLAAHPMHEERFEVSEAAANEIRDARAEARPIVAVGTTVVRTLESASDAEGNVKPGLSSTGLFIFPPFEFRVVDALLTNFHLPRSTLLALVMAFATPSMIQRAYEEAVRERYRFYSYGDAMLIGRGL